MALADTAQLAVELKLKDEMSGALSRAQNQLNQFDQKVKTTAGGLTGAFQRSLGTVDQNLTKAFSHMGQGLRTAAGNIEKLGLAAGGLAIGGAAAAVKWAGDFEAQLHTINTVAGLTPTALSALGDQLRQVARDTGLSLDEITSGYYDLVSAGVKGDLAVSTLNDAVKLGIGGLATTGETIDLLTTAINAYGLDAAGAAKATDQFALAVADGKVKANEIAATFANVASIAKAYGVGIDQISASFAYLTAQGVPASEVTTEMQRAIVSLVSPTKDLEKAGKALGVSWEQEVRNKGLVPALQEIRDYSEKSGVPLNKLLGRIEGVKYLLQTTGPNLTGFNAELAKMGTASGIAAEQMSERQQGLNFQLNRLKAEVKDAGITIGSALIPKLVPLFDSLNKFLDTHRGDIAQFGTDLANAFEGAARWIEKLDFGQIADDLKVAGTFAKGIIQAFLAAPPWLQQAVVTGWGLNKLTGGAVVNVGLDLAKGALAGSIFGRGGPGNPLYVVDEGVGKFMGGGGLRGILDSALAFLPAAIAGAIAVQLGQAFLQQSSEINVQGQSLVTQTGSWVKTASTADLNNALNTIAGQKAGNFGLNALALGLTDPFNHGLENLDKTQKEIRDELAYRVAHPEADIRAQQGLLAQQQSATELAHLTYLQGEHNSYAGQTARSVGGMLAKLDTLHLDFEKQRGLLASKDVAAQTAAAKTIAEDILKGVGGAVSTRNTLEQLQAARKTATDPALIKALDEAIAAANKKLPGREFIAAQEKAADKIVRGNLPLSQKITQLQAIQRSLDGHSQAGMAHVASEIDALKSHIDATTSAVRGLRGFAPIGTTPTVNSQTGFTTGGRPIIVNGGTSDRSNVIARTRTTRFTTVRSSAI